MQRLSVAIGAGLWGGAFAGAAEALFILQAGIPAEYQAFGVAWTLYGVCGAALGVAFAVALVPAFRWLSLQTFAALVFTCVATTLSGSAFLLGGSVASIGFPWMFAVIGADLVVIWLGSNLVAKTPLRALTGARGWAPVWIGATCLAWIFALSPPPSGADAPAGGTNGPLVVVLAIDALRRDAFAVSPGANIAALSAESVTFDQYIVSSASVGSSTASLYTSSSPPAHHCEGRRGVLAAQLTTMAEVASERGFTTIGLPNSVETAAGRGFDQGFGSYLLAPRLPFGAEESSANLVLFRAVWHAGPRLGLQTGPEVPTFRSAGEQATAVLAAVADLGNSGGLVYAELSDLMAVFPSSDPVARMLRGPVEASVNAAVVVRAQYTASALDIDRAVGQIVAGLAKQGRFEDSALILVSLGGAGLYDHGRLSVGGDVYDEQVRVPLIVKLPHARHAQLSVPWQVREVDVAPTVVDMLGAQSPGEWEGAELFGDGFDRDIAAPESTDGDLAPPAPPGWEAHPASRDALMQERRGAVLVQGLRRRGKKLMQEVSVENAGDRPVRVGYYDLVGDPGERQDLAGQSAPGEGESKAALATMLEGRRTRLARSVGDVEPAEREQLCAIGYFSKVECEGFSPR